MDLGVHTSVPPNTDPEANVPQCSTSGEASDRQPPEGPDSQRGQNDASRPSLIRAISGEMPLLKALEAG